eukprot:28882-Chlamydomonas_euryale.AAC.1
MSPPAHRPAARSPAVVGAAVHDYRAPDAQALLLIGARRAVLLVHMHLQVADVLTAHLLRQVWRGCGAQVWGGRGVRVPDRSGGGMARRCGTCAVREEWGCSTCVAQVWAAQCVGGAAPATSACRGEHVGWWHWYRCIAGTNAGFGAVCRTVRGSGHMHVARGRVQTTLAENRCARRCVAAIACMWQGGGCRQRWLRIGVPDGAWQRSHA